jgi:hypothetical protein
MNFSDRIKGVIFSNITGAKIPQDAARWVDNIKQNALGNESRGFTIYDSREMEQLDAFIAGIQDGTLDFTQWVTDANKRKEELDAKNREEQAKLNERDRLYWEGILKSEQESLVDMSFVLVKWSDNWADEMDLESFTVMTKAHWLTYEKELSEAAIWPHSINVGTNEDIKYKNWDGYRKSLSIRGVSNDEFEVLNSLFGLPFSKVENPSISLGRFPWIEDIKGILEYKQHKKEHPEMYSRYDDDDEDDDDDD